MTTMPPEYNIAHMKRRWETQTKYYEANLCQDLFGEWILMKYWGNKTSKLGGSQSTLVASLNDGLTLMETVKKRRNARGYFEV